MEEQIIINEYLDFIKNMEFPCIGAKTALVKGQLKCMVAGHMACPRSNQKILNFLSDFTSEYRKATTLFHTAAVIFKTPIPHSEEMFEGLLWQRLQALSDLDAQTHAYDNRVDKDPNSPNFSFSVGEEAFFIVGLHPKSSRLARQFKYPTLVFNPHAQFEKLRETDQYKFMQAVIRARDMNYSGSVNPMLDDFGNSSEVHQYSGRQHGKEWKCPIKIDHERNKDNKHDKHDPAA